MHLSFASFFLLIAATVANAEVPRIFSIGGEPFAQSEVADARALPQVDGLPVVMITFEEAAAKRFLDLTRRNIGKQITVVVNGKVISSPVIQTEVAGGVVELSGLQSFEDAIAMAKLISGKEPLPDSLEDTP
jgi:preprotein translocase subunit SecD